MIAVVAITAALLALAWALLYVKKTLEAGAQFRFADSDKPVPSAGLLSSQLHLMHLHESQQELPRQLGEASLLYMLAKPALLLGNAPAVREMMMERWEEFERLTDSFNDNAFLGSMLQESLFILDDAEWKVLRKRLSGGFKFNVLKAMVPHFNECSNKLGDHWEREIRQSPSGTTATVDVSQWLTKMTTEVIGIVAFGVNFNAIAEGESAYLRHVNRIMQESTNFLSYIPGFSYLPTPGNNSMKAAVRELTAVTLGVIEARKQLLQENLDVDGFEPPNDILQTMLSGDHGESLTMQGIFSNAIGFLLAGSETTSVALSWALFLLAKHPSIQDQAREEARAALAGGEPDFAASEKLKYIGFIIKETMRLYPPAWMNVRRAAHATELGGVRVPKGGMVIVPTMYLHRAEKYWGATASEFIPDRWNVGRISAGDFQEPPRGAYLPFNIGPRDCIGARFAVLEMKVVLAKLLTRFQFNPEPGFEPQFSMAETLVPKNGMSIRISLV